MARRSPCRAALCLVLAVALAGCATKADVSGWASSFTTTGVPPVGMSSSGGTVGVNIQGASGGAAVAAAVVIVALLGIWRDAPLPRAVPEMLEGRAVLEADCSQPIEDWSKNLKCR